MTAMERQKKRIHNGSMILWTLVILIQMSVIQSLDVRAQTGEAIPAQVTILSDIYTAKDHADAPAEEYVDEEGRLYQLDTWELVPIIVKEKSKPVEKVIRYPGVEGAARIPGAIEVTVRVGDVSTAVSCELDTQKTIQEQWENDFAFPVTFHMYDSGYYQLADQVIPYNEERPEFDGCEMLLLDMIGVSAAEYRITDILWSGSEYQNEAGEHCRDAFARGEKLVREIEAVYQGQAVIPGYQGWQTQAVYRPEQEDSQAVAESEPESIPAVVETTLPAEDEEAAPPALWQKIMNTLLITVGIGALLFFGGVLILMLLHLVKKVRTCYNKLHQK